MGSLLELHIVPNLFFLSINSIWQKILGLEQCLKITEKVAFIIASEASYAHVYKNSLKMIKMVNFGKF